MFNPTVQLKSGGYIVIGVTEALVAIDVNSGRATKEGSIEETALKTNLEAAEEVARQLRLRDLAGLIVIDFIDMDERRNNTAVEKRMKDKLKTDRARIQVGRISGFGLMEMSRQRLRPGMIEATTQPCQACHGTGLIRSDDNLALSILRQIEEEGTRRRSREVLVKAPVGIANFIMNQKREHVAQIEMRYGLSVRIEGDPMLISPDFALEKFKTATRNVPEAGAPVVSVDSSLMDDIDDEAQSDAVAAEGETAAPPQEDEENRPRKRRRRRRRRKSKSENGGDDVSADAQSGEGDKPADAADNADAPEDEATPAEEKPVEEKPADAAEADAGEDAPKPKAKRTRKPRKKASEAETETPAEAGETAPEPAEEAEEKPKKRRSRAKKKEPETAEAAPAEPETTETVFEPVVVTAEPVADVAVADAPEPAAEEVADSDKPKRRGWWSLGR